MQHLTQLLERDDANVPGLDYQPTFASTERFLTFLRASRAGDRLAYAVCGNLGRDNPDGARSDVPRLAWQAYELGWVDLVQRRLGPYKYEYIVIRRRHRRVKKVKASSYRHVVRPEQRAAAA